MKPDIVAFLKESCTRLRLSANYVARKDMYVVHKRGYAIQNFTTVQFYQIPKKERIQMFLAILQRGLTHNLGEKDMKNNIISHTQHGIRII